MQKDILDFLSEFAVFLQDHKFAVSESALAHLLRSVEAARVDITEEDEMLAALSEYLKQLVDRGMRERYPNADESVVSRVSEQKNNPAKRETKGKREAGETKRTGLICV